MRALKNDGIVREILNGIQPTQAVFVDYSSLIMDVLPYLSRLIVPTFRAVNEHLHSSEEKEDLKRIVGVMADYNLTYVQERTADGMYAYNIGTYAWKPFICGLKAFIYAKIFLLCRAGH